MLRRNLIAAIGTTALGLGLLVGAPTHAAPVDLAIGGDVRINGEAERDYAGYSLSEAGDVNGDGKGDLVIGAYGADPQSLNVAGAAYVVFGGDLPPALDLVDLGRHGFRIDGAVATDETGTTVAGPGDVNGDGLDDVLIGAPYASPSGRMSAGSAFVVFGQATTTNVDLAALGARGFRIDGAAAQELLGRAVTGVGDLNRDGKDDLLVGAPFADNRARENSGSAYLVYGSVSTATVDTATLGARGFRMDGDVGELCGYTLAGPGDVNNDGAPDFLVGARGADHNGRGNSGSVYLVYGSPTSPDRDLTALSGSGMRIDGAAAAEEIGARGMSTGDVNGDGTADFLLGTATATADGRTMAGVVHVVFGAATTEQLDLASPGPRAIRIIGPSPAAYLGWATGFAGDFDGDGLGDIVAGAPIVDANGRGDSGSTYIVPGSRNLADVDLATFSGWRFDGAGASDTSGTAVAGLGDVNGDGGDDVAIGSFQADALGRTDAGAVHLKYGTAPAPVITPTLPATLTVAARAARKAVPRTGRATLVRGLTVGAGQSARITVKVTPKKARKKVQVIKTATTVKVRARKAPRGKVTATIVSSGSGFTPTTWTRTWKVR